MYRLSLSDHPMQSQTLFKNKLQTVKTRAKEYREEVHRLRYESSLRIHYSRLLIAPHRFL